MPTVEVEKLLRQINDKVGRVGREVVHLSKTVDRLVTLQDHMHEMLHDQYEMLLKLQPSTADMTPDEVAEYTAKLKAIEDKLKGLKDSPG